MKYNILKQMLQIYKYSVYSITPSHLCVLSPSILLYICTMYTVVNALFC